MRHDKRGGDAGTEYDGWIGLGKHIAKEIRNNIDRIQRPQNPRDQQTYAFFILIFLLLS